MKPNPPDRKVSWTDNLLTIILSLTLIATLVWWLFFSEDAVSQPDPADSPPLEEPR